MSRTRALLLAAVLGLLALGSAEAQDGPRILSMDQGERPRGWTTRLADEAVEQPPFDPGGYTRADFLPEIFMRRLDRVPARGLDYVRYWATSVGDLSATCPGLGLESVSRDALPHVGPEHHSG